LKPSRVLMRGDPRTISISSEKVPPATVARVTSYWPWIAAVADKLAALRGPGEGYSDVILLRLVEMEERDRSILSLRQPR
jgi:hypothetical protein